MNISQRLLWNIYAGVVGAATTLVAAKLVGKAWEVATGDLPPEPNDPQVPLRRALTWAVASGIGVGLAQLIMNRVAARQWERATGHPAPGLSKQSRRV